LHQFVGYVIINTMQQYVADSAALAIAVVVCLFLTVIISRYMEPVVRGTLAAWLARAHTGAVGLIERA
jgi:hypothetical protein